MTLAETQPELELVPQVPVEHDLPPAGGCLTPNFLVLSRHTFTTNLIRAGQDLVLVAELTVHARLETVRRYSLPAQKDKERAVAALPTDR
jgi:integrase/recombinase XerD